jgi:surface antigen
MSFVRSAMFGALLLIAGTFASPASAQFWQCAPFARMASGIELYGNAGTWWAKADGRFDRGHRPRVGSVMVMKPFARMRVGHVAMVSGVVSEREITVTHANWSRRGGIERDVRVVDVSPANDWSEVKVWYAGNGDLGSTSYPTFGFIYANRPATQFADARTGGAGVPRAALR